MIDRIASMIRNAVTRGKVANAAIGARTVLQSTGLDNETFNGIELLLPPGYSARPLANADVVHFQVLGSRDHVVALGGDTAGADMIANLAPGEFGLRNAAAGIQIVMRNTGIVEITGNVTITGYLHVAGAVVAGYGGADQVDVQTHVQSGVQPGGSNTGPPVAGT